MNIHYEIHAMKNASGTGKERKFVVIRHSDKLSDKEMLQSIEKSTTLTESDLRGALSALRQIAVRQLASGNRFHIPGIGWLELSAALDRSAQTPGHKITGKDIAPNGIRFQPESAFCEEAARDVSFRQSDYTTLSRQYDEDTLREALSTYLADKGYVTRATFAERFGLSRYSTDQWLRHFVDDGFLTKVGSRHNVIFVKGTR